MNKILHVGLDVGSTTVKIIVMDDNQNLIYENYQRHFSDTKNTVCQVLSDFANKYHDYVYTIALTGSGAMSAAKFLDLPFIQEVVACKRAVEKYIPQTDVVIELGGEDAPIVVIGREAGSGTRGAFEELLELEDACAYASELDSTGAVIAKVAATPGAIGYVSLDALDDTVKALALDDVEATAENIKAGNYFLSRPFVMATKGEISEQSEAVQELFKYLASDEGKQVISGVGLITVD